MIDVAIVGSGPVGTLLAAELARLGVAAERLERRPTAGDGSRAVGVHATALALMEASGATDRLLETALRVRVGEARRRGRALGEVRFDRLPTRHPFVATLPQSQTEAALAATAAAWGAPPPQYGIAVTALRDQGEGVDISTDATQQPREIRARFVVVAGGLRARTLLPIEARRRVYPDRYLMTDADDRSGDGDRAVVHLDPAGVLESFPLPEGRRRYVAWMPERDAGAGDDAALLRDAVAARTGSDAAASAVHSATWFGVGRSRLAALRTGRVVAIGDTAHEVSPIGGQGMNLGLIDAVTLAPVLARWVREGAAPASLDAWERSRLRAADRAGRIAALNTTLGRPSRSGGARGGADGDRGAAATAVRLALRSPAERLLAHAYSMGFDPAARFARAPR